MYAFAILFLDLKTTFFIVPSILAHGYHSTASFMALSPLIKEILTKPVGTEVVVKGWVKSLRIHKNVGFVTITDGSNLGGIQV